MTAQPAVVAPARLDSIDTYRGFVMLLMMAEVLNSGAVARALPSSAFWRVFESAQTHVDWVGCSLHDLIQPSFSFLVGVALPFSLAARRARQHPLGRLWVHACWRAALLVLLGVFLRSVGRPETNWTFEDTLTQIGLGYPLLFLLGLTSSRIQWIAVSVICSGYWLAWAVYPVAGPSFDFARVGVPADWPHHAQGFAAHWNKNANLGARFDEWFLNLFPRSKPFIANTGGYLTLSFIPTLATMILGLIAGSWLRAPLANTDRIRRLLILGLGGILVGLSLHLLGVCPIVKRIWTPAWTLFSAGCCAFLLAGFYSIIDVRSWRRWAFPLRVIGMNSIAAYLAAHLFEGFISSSLSTHLGTGAFSLLGDVYAPFVRGLLVLITLWCGLLWMYRRKLFLKI